MVKYYKKIDEILRKILRNLRKYWRNLEKNFVKFWKIIGKIFGVNFAEILKKM